MINLDLINSIYHNEIDPEQEKINEAISFIKSEEQKIQKLQKLKKLSDNNSDQFEFKYKAELRPEHISISIWRQALIKLRNQELSLYKPEKKDETQASSPDARDVSRKSISISPFLTRYIYKSMCKKLKSNTDTNIDASSLSHETRVGVSDTASNYYYMEKDQGIYKDFLDKCDQNINSLISQLNNLGRVSSLESVMEEFEIRSKLIKEREKKTKFLAEYQKFLNNFSKLDQDLTSLWQQDCLDQDTSNKSDINTAINTDINRDIQRQDSFEWFIETKQEFERLSSQNLGRGVILYPKCVIS